MVNLTAPAPIPQAQILKPAKIDKPLTPHDAAIEGDLKMPHERDESVDMTNEERNPLVEQAAADVNRGLQDTSNGVELNRAYKKLK